MMAKLDFDDGRFSYQPTKVIYRGKEFPAPVDGVVLMAWDYIGELLEERQKERR